MELNFHNIIKMLPASGLNPQEQDDITGFLSLAPDAELKPLATLCMEDPAWIKRFYDNYRAKRSAIETESPELWEKILQDEEKFLKEVDA